MKKTKKKTE